MSIEKGQVWLVRPWEFTPHELPETWEIVKNGRESIEVVQRTNSGRGPKVKMTLPRRVVESILARRGELQGGD